MTAKIKYLLPLALLSASLCNAQSSPGTASASGHRPLLDALDQLQRQIQKPINGHARYHTKAAHPANLGTREQSVF